MMMTIMLMTSVHDGKSDGVMTRMMMTLMMKIMMMIRMMTAMTIIMRLVRVTTDMITIVAAPSAFRIPSFFCGCCQAKPPTG